MSPRDLSPYLSTSCVVCPEQIGQAVHHRCVTQGDPEPRDLCPKFHISGRPAMTGSGVDAAEAVCRNCEHHQEKVPGWGVFFLGGGDSHVSASVISVLTADEFLSKLILLIPPPALGQTVSVALEPTDTDPGLRSYNGTFTVPCPLCGQPYTAGFATDSAPHPHRCWGRKN